jgi:predicted nucleic acid-binding protein
MRLVLDTNVLVTAFRSRTGAAAEVLRLMKTADYFAKRAARADFAVFDRLM